MGSRVFVLFCAILQGARSSIIVILFSLQMFDADSHQNHLPTRIKPDLKDFPSTLFRSKADSTVKKYKNEFLKFIEWGNLSNGPPVPPFPSLGCSSACNKLNCV